MTDAEIFAIRKGLAEAQGWRRDALEPKPGWRPLWPYRRGQERKTDWPDPFTDAHDFVQLLAWALRRDIDIYATCRTSESSQDCWAHAKRLFGPKAGKAHAESEECSGDVPALMRAVTLAIWAAIREDENDERRGETMNYETAEERGALTIPAPKFALGQIVKVKGGHCRGAVQARVYCPDESFWLYSILRGDNMQFAGYLAEYALESADR